MKRFFSFIITLLLFSSPLLASVGFITNKGNDTLTVIDSASEDIIATIPVGEDPVSVVLTPDKTTLFVANQASNSISMIKINLDSHPFWFQVLDPLDSLPISAPNSLVMDPNGKYLIIGNGGNNSLNIIDISSSPMTGTALNIGFTVVGPKAMSITSDGSLLYVCNHSSNSVAVINMVDANNPAILDPITVGNAPSSVAISPDDDFAAVANKTDGTVSIIQVPTSTVVKTVTVGTNPSSVAFDYSSNEVYVTNSGDNTISTISLTTSNAIPVEDSPRRIVLAPNGEKAYVINQNSNSVSIFDTATFEVLANVNVGDTPVAVAVTLDNSKAYVANDKSCDVSVINTSTYAVDVTIPVTTPTTSTIFPVNVSDIAISHDGSRALVTLASDGELAFIDTSINSVVKKISTSQDPILNVSITNPTSIFVHPTNGFAYIYNRYSYLGMLPLGPGHPSCCIVNISGGSVLKEIFGGTLDTGFMGMTPGAGSYVYLVNPGFDNFSIFGNLAGTTNIIDTSTNEQVGLAITGVSPTAAAATSNTEAIFIANGPIGTLNVVENSIFTISTADGIQTFQQPIIFTSPNFMKFTPDNNILYTINTSLNTLTSYLQSSDILLSLGPFATVTVGKSPQEIVFSSDSNLGFVTNRLSNTVSVVATNLSSTNPVAANLFNTVLPVLNNATVSTTESTDIDPEVIVPDAPVIPKPKPEPEPVVPVCSCPTAVWIVNTNSNTVTIGPANNPKATTFAGLNAPSDIVVTVQKERLPRTVFTMEVVEHVWCKERFANLQWSKFENALEYKIYRNDEFLVELGPEATSYEDHNLELNRNYTYTLYMCTANGTLVAYLFDLIDSF